MTDKIIMQQVRLENIKKVIQFLLFLNQPYNLCVNIIKVYNKLINNTNNYIAKWLLNCKKKM